jgi:hypothetical protein
MTQIPATTGYNSAHPHTNAAHRSHGRVGRTRPVGSAPAPQLETAAEFGAFVRDVLSAQPTTSQ